MEPGPVHVPGHPDSLLEPTPSHHLLDPHPDLVLTDHEQERVGAALQQPLKSIEHGGRLLRLGDEAELANQERARRESQTSPCLLARDPGHLGWGKPRVMGDHRHGDAVGRDLDLLSRAGSVDDRGSRGPDHVAGQREQEQLEAGHGSGSAQVLEAAPDRPVLGHQELAVFGQVTAPIREQHVLDEMVENDFVEHGHAWPPQAGPVDEGVEGVVAEVVEDRVVSMRSLAERSRVKDRDPGWGLYQPAEPRGRTKGLDLRLLGEEGEQFGRVVGDT